MESRFAAAPRQTTQIRGVTYRVSGKFIWSLPEQKALKKDLVSSLSFRTRENIRLFFE